MVFWPLTLGLSVLAAGLFVHRRDLRLSAIAKVFIAAPLAAFAGEHFTIAANIAELVPQWLPARLFIAYFVGVAELAAAVSLVAGRATRWSTLLLAIMFGLFVLLMDLPAAIETPGNRLFWILAVRETSFAMGALALFNRQARSSRLATLARWWMGLAILYYGLDHLLHPELSPGVPNSKPTSSWVPLPLIASSLTGALLIACGGGMLVRGSARIAAHVAGALLLALTVVLYGPDLFLAHTSSERLGAINFIFDTLLFSGVLLAAAPEALDSAEAAARLPR